MKEMMDLYRKAYGVPEDGADQARPSRSGRSWPRSVGRSARSGCRRPTTGVRIVKNTMGNIPDRLFNSASHKSPGSSLPPTYYFKS